MSIKKVLLFIAVIVYTDLASDSLSGINQGEADSSA